MAGLLKKMMGNGGSKLKPLLSEAAASALTRIEQRHAENVERCEHVERKLAGLEEQRVAMLVQSPGSSGARNLFAGERDELQAAEAEAARTEKALALANQKLEASREGEPTEEELASIQSKFGAAKAKLDASIGEYLTALGEFEEAHTLALSRLGRSHAISQMTTGLLGLARFRLRLWLGAPQNEGKRWMQ